MDKLLTVILPTYNPDPVRLDQTIRGLRNQTLSSNFWELIIVDNCSMPAVLIDISWHRNHTLVREEKQGLTYARLKGFELATGGLVLMVDDDNILDSDYLQQAIQLFNKHSSLGAAGGKSIPLFESPPQAWLKEFYGNLALRDLGENDMMTGWKNEYPNFAPIGAGMVIRKKAIENYITKVKSGVALIADRTGKGLTSGGDNDIIIEILRSGWQVGYFAVLRLQHIIPRDRMQTDYLSRLAYDSNRSWVQVLDKHQINPWKKISSLGIKLRKTKAWFSYNAWKNQASYVRWKGACGLFEGLLIKKEGEKT